MTEPTGSQGGDSFLSNWPGLVNQQPLILSPSNGQLRVFIDDVGRTWQHQHDIRTQLSHATTKFMVESSELVNLFCKYLYHNQEFDPKDIVDELGDVLFYLFAMLVLSYQTSESFDDKNEFEFSPDLVLDMGTVLEYNIKKREKRYKNGYEQQEYERKEKEKKNDNGKK